MAHAVATVKTMIQGAKCATYECDLPLKATLEDRISKIEEGLAAFEVSSLVHCR